MPFEPLNTDEPLPPGKNKKEKDFETVILGGCTSFVFTSVVTYVLALWPFLVMQRIDRLQTLIIACVCGPIIAYVFGIITSRKMGLAAACGFVAGAMTFLVFISLRIDQVFLAAAAGQAKNPQYPDSFRIIIPAVWILGAFAIAFIFTPKKEVSIKD